MLFHPAQLGLAHLDKATLEADKKACKKIGPCGVGKKALYLNSFYIDRRYYLPYTSITRVFKRVAMSSGGFSGKGVFASMAYLVVEYDGGKQKQCNFKDERDVDALLELLAKQQPQIRLLSAAVFLKGIEISNLRHTVAGAFTVNEVLIAKFDVAGVAQLLRGHFGVDALGGPDDNGAGERFLNGHAIREFTALRSGSHRLPALTRLFEALDQLFGGDFECRLLPGLLDALPLEPRMVRVRFRIEFSLRHPYTGRHEILLFVQAGDDALLLLLGHLTEDDAFVLDLVVVRIAVQVMNSGIHHFFSS
mgnify:CR=1 FL=1